MEKITKTEKETEDFGKELAKKLIKETPKERAQVVVLKGELGGGKTTFVKGFAKGLGIEELVTSPTFVIFRSYPLSSGKKFYHFDCYRIEKEEELKTLGFDEILNNPKNIVVLEWGDKIENLPSDKLTISFEFINEETRKLLID